MMTLPRACRLMLALILLPVVGAVLMTTGPAHRLHAQDGDPATAFSDAERDEFLAITRSTLGNGHRAAKAESVADSVGEMDARAKERMDRMLRGLRERERDRTRKELLRRFIDVLAAGDDRHATDNDTRPADDGKPAAPEAGQIEAATEFLRKDAAGRAEQITQLDADHGKLDKATAAQWTAAALKAAAAAGTFKANGETLQAGGHTMRYHVEGELKAGDPLFIYLHGGGADAQTNDVCWRAVFNVHKGFGFSAGVSARVPDDTSVVGWREDSAVMCIARLIDELVNTHQLDTNRIYIVGGSMGAWGISTMAPALADRVTAFCCHYGGGCEYRGFGMENTRNTPMCIGIGDADTQFGRLQGTRFLKDLLVKLHEADPAGYDLHYEEWPGGGHAPGRGCEATFGKWLLERTRDPAPKTIAWQPTRGFRNRFAWLERAAPVAVRPGVSNLLAKAVIEGNTIRLTGNAAGLIINLNDDLVDLSQPVKVMSGDSVVFNGKVARRASLVLQSVATSPDPARVYCARIELK